VEEGLPMLRVANNGISAVIDAQGRIRHRLDLDVVGVIDATVPPAGLPTLYGRFGDLWFALILLFGAGFVMAGRMWHGRSTAIS
jgi:apolipoprotein N-acyltransferase